VCPLDSSAQLVTAFDLRFGLEGLAIEPQCTRHLRSVSVYIRGFQMFNRIVNLPLARHYTR